MSELDDRKEQVLKAVVVEYTSTAVPVGSQALAARHFERWSAATIRNELAHLMDSGHLMQPHTSSGRVPSDLGYRYFVDFLMVEEAVGAETRGRLDQLFGALPADIESILERTAMALAREADSVGVVTSPRASENRLKYNDLIHLEGTRVLAVVVLEGNLVRQQPLDLPTEADQDQLSQFANRLNKELKGKRTAEIADYLKTPGLRNWETAVVHGIHEFMLACDAQSATVVVHDGVRNLLKQPEFGDAVRLLPVLELLEESRVLARIMESFTPSERVTVVIGDENPDLHLRECTMILTNYGSAGVTGTMGMIGPTRMRYPQVLARIRYISELTGQAISRVYE